MKRSLLLIALFAFALIALSPAAAQDDPVLTVIATTTILADVARNVGGDLVNVESLLPADTDTHAYEPTVEDAARVADADMLLVVGIGYEEFLGGLLESVGDDVPVVVASNGIEILASGASGHDEDEANAIKPTVRLIDHATEEPGGDPDADHEDEEHAAGEILGVLGDDFECEAHEDEDHEEGDAETTEEATDADAEGTEEADADHEEGGCDPHVWMNPLNVMLWATNIGEAFAAADLANADQYRANAAAYAAQLEAVDQQVQEILAEVPEDRRVLVTNHDFMGYFAAHYEFEVVATVLPGSDTNTELDPQALAALIDLVRDENVPAIFAEMSANPDLADLVAEEAGVAVVITLYSEALSDAQGGASTYIDFMTYNAQTIADALR